MSDAGADVSAQDTGRCAMDPAYWYGHPCKVCNERGIRWLRLFHLNIGLAVVGGGLGVHVEDIRHRYSDCGEEAGYKLIIRGG